MSKMKDFIADITAYEEGQMSDDEQAGFLASLYNTRSLRSLQGHYQRAFAHLVDSGDITFDNGTAVTRF
jgi:hypothetical protein